jgi:hypothetical protein
MKDFLLVVNLYGAFSQDPIQCKLMREQMQMLGMDDYLVNDLDERIALPDNVYADWIAAEDCDSLITEWNLKISEIFHSNNLKGCSFITVGTEAVWWSQGFW